MTLFDLFSKFPTEQSIVDYIIDNILGGKVVCPKCGKIHKIYKYRNKLKVFHCKNCNSNFSIFKDTIFENTHLDLRKWFFIIYQILIAKKGISACQLQREIGGSYKTSWRILKQVRKAMGNTNTIKVFSSIVEIDETYVGGRPRKENIYQELKEPLVIKMEEHLTDNRSFEEIFNQLEQERQQRIEERKLKHKRGRGCNKIPVVGIKERKSGKVIARVMLPNEEGKCLSGKQLLSLIEELCMEQSCVLTDDFRGYWILDKEENKRRFLHISVNHSKGEYSSGDGSIHTNGIESFWAVLKRGVIGVYHHISSKYLQNYVDEFCFRSGFREELNCVEVFNQVLEQGFLTV